MGEKIGSGTIHVGEIIGKTLDGKDIYKFTELGMAENVKIIEPQYKDGDFVVNMRGSVLIFRKKFGDSIYDHAIFNNVFGLSILPLTSSDSPIRRHATEEEKQELLDALAKAGKRWNEEKKCVEDIPKRKFNVGDKVVLKSRHKKTDGLQYLTDFDRFIGKPLTIRRYTDNGCVYFSDCPYIFHEDWLEPYVEKLKKGDLAIFWDNSKKYAVIRFYEQSYGSETRFRHKDSFGLHWINAIKFESKKQFKRFIKGEL